MTEAQSSMVRPAIRDVVAKFAVRRNTNGFDFYAYTYFKPVNLKHLPIIVYVRIEAEQRTDFRLYPRVGILG